MLNPDDVAAAARRIAGQVRRTPTITVEAGALADLPLVLKLEHLQRSGSFKARGAFHFLLTQPVPGRPPRVVTASGGNHGLAVAVAASSLGMVAEVFVPVTTPAAKLDGLRDAGATVHPVGETYAEAAVAAVEYADRCGAPYLHAYDHPAVVAGQGTAVLELIEDGPQVDTVLVAVGGGGLLGGTVAALSGTRTAAVGVEPERCPTLHSALANGAPTDVQVGGVAVDSLGARRLGEVAFELISAAGTHSVLVADEDILAARTVLWRELRLAVEPAAAAALAALRSGAYLPGPDERVALLVCGGNASPAGLG